MFFKNPENTKDFYWTNHIKRKMMYYRLSEARLRRILRNPTRKEEGIAPDTIAVMQPIISRVKFVKKTSEIWLMYQLKGKRKIMISAWRYPGISPKRKAIPIPDNILEELKQENLIDFTNLKK